MVLQNPLSFAAFSVVMWRFFSARIKCTSDIARVRVEWCVDFELIDEEAYLVRFFGDDYKAYRKTVGTWIPFIY